MNLIRRLDDKKLGDAIQRIERLERELALMAKMVNRLSGGYYPEQIAKESASHASVSCREMTDEEIRQKLREVSRYVCRNDSQPSGDELKRDLRTAIARLEQQEEIDCLLDATPDIEREDDVDDESQPDFGFMTGPLPDDIEDDE